MEFKTNSGVISKRVAADTSQKRRDDFMLSELLEELRSNSYFGSDALYEHFRDYVSRVKSRADF